MDKAFTVRSLDSFDRCPYAYRLDLTEACRGQDPQDFLDKVVRYAIATLNRRRLCGHQVDKDSALAAFWNAWDTETETNPMFPDSGKAELLKIGEKCMTNFVRFASSFGNTEIMACDLRGEQAVPGGTVSINIDEVSARGGTVVITKYVCEPGIRTKADFENDQDMYISAQWARYNIPGADKVILQWRLLHPYIELEAEFPLAKVDSVVRELGRRVMTLKACQDFRQRETGRCDQCQYRNDCPRFTHGSSGDADGRELVTRYAEFQEKIDALKSRIELLEAQRDEVGRKLIDYADGHGYTAMTDGTYKATVSHLKKAELPKEKAEVVRRLEEIGKLQEMSTVNYSRLRADIAKGIADRRIAELALIIDQDRVNLRKIR